MSHHEARNNSSPTLFPLTELEKVPSHNETRDRSPIQILLFQEEKEKGFLWHMVKKNESSSAMTLPQPSSIPRIKIAEERESPPRKGEERYTALSTRPRQKPQNV
jgi:hypothetical protein